MGSSTGRALWIVVAVAAAGCRTPAGTEEAPDAGPPPGDAAVPEDDAAGSELPPGTVVLEPNGEGKEVGVTTSDDSGTVRFYSPVHETLVDFTLEDHTLEMPQRGVQVMVAVDSGGMARFAAWDPESRFMPLGFSAALPNEDAELEVSGIDQLEGDAPLYEFDPEEGNPFAGTGSLTIPTTLVKVAIKGVLIEVGIGAGVLVAKHFIMSVCSSVAPLHDDVCNTLGNAIEVLGTVVKPGFKLLTRGITRRALVTKTASGVGGWFARQQCEGWGGAVATKWTDPTSERHAQLRTDYRRAAWMYNYLLHQLDTNPPDDVASMKQMLEDVFPVLALAGPQVREAYVELYGPEELNEIGEAHKLKALSKATRALVGGEASIEVGDATSSVVFRKLVQPAGGAAVTFAEVRAARSTKKLYQLDSRLLKHGFGCAVSFVAGFKGEIEEAGETREATLQMDEAFGASVRLAILRMEHFYEDAYGDSVPEGSCLPDEYEPNADWEQAVSAPASITLDAEPVRITDLNLCTFTGDAAEEDWYAFPMGPISLNAQARIRVPESGSPAGTDQHLCMEMLFYSKNLEIIGDPPVKIAGPVCGEVGDELSTRSVSVARTTGEPWSFIIMRVYPDPAHELTADTVDYDLGFTL